MADKVQIYIIEDDVAGCESLTAVLEARGFAVQAFSTGEAWLNHRSSVRPCCAILDLNLGQGISGLDVLRKMAELEDAVPVIMISAFGDIRTAVTAMRLGAIDFIEKPFVNDELVAAIEAAIESQSDELVLRTEIRETERIVGGLNDRETKILSMICDGTANKVIANRLGLGLRTVESSRADVLKKFGATSWPEVISRVIRFETYRAKHPKVSAPKFMERRGREEQGPVDEQVVPPGNDSIT